jgi:hypothetical protein
MWQRSVISLQHLVGNTVMTEVLRSSTNAAPPKYATTPSGVPGELKDKWRDKVRKTFYKGNYRQFNYATTLNKPGVYVPNSKSKRFVCQGCKQEFTLTKGKANEITMDHLATSVVEHWEQKGGNNTTQGVRNEWYDDPGNLQMLCGPCNASKGKGNTTATYSSQVGPDFRGPDGER